MILEGELRVLIVDDDPEDIDLVRDLLDDIEFWSAAVTTATRYEEGLDALDSGDYDVCLLDYQLGAKSGVDFLAERRVREAGMPVILLTGMSSPEVDRQAWEAGAAAYLPKKDLSVPLLDRTVRYALERTRRRRAEARFDKLVARGRELVCVTDVDDNLKYVSPSVQRILGFDPERVLDQPDRLVVHPDDRDRVEQSMDSISRAEPGEVHHLQYRLRHADGGWRILDTLVENRLDDPDIRGLVFRSWDVTDRIEREEQIRFQATLLDAVGQAVVATDLDGRIVYWNRAAERIYGWSEEEALGEPVAELTPADMTRAEAKEIMASLQQGESWSGEFEVRRKDGSPFTALVTNAPILDSEDRQIGIVGVSSDISDLKQVEADLRERVKEQRTLYRATRILHRQDLDLDERLQRFVETLPPGWLYPEITCARLTLEEGGRIETDGFQETPWTLTAEVGGGDESFGTLEVALVEERPTRDEGPFLAEERALLDTLANTVAEALQRDRLNRHLSQTVASLEEAVIIVDSRGDGRGIVRVNPAAEEMFGYSMDEMIGKTTEHLHVSPENFRRFAEEGVPALERDGVFRATYPLKRSDGNTFEAEQTVTLLDPSKGMEGGVVSVIRDVSEARRAERQLRASEERFRQIAERIEDVFWISSPGKDRMLYLSPAFETIWGREREEVYRDPALWMEPVVEEDRERVRRYVDRQPEGEQEVEYRIRRPDGQIRWIHDRSFPVGGTDGETVQVVGVAEDITQRREVEERLQAIIGEMTDAVYILDEDGRVGFSTPAVEDIAGIPATEFEGMDALGLVHDEDIDRVRDMSREILQEQGSSMRIQYRIVDRQQKVHHVESVVRNLMDRPGVHGLLVATRDITERVELENKMRQSQRLEAVGRLAGGIAHDFNNLLTVIRGETDLLLMELEEDDPLIEEVDMIQTTADRAAHLTSQLLAFGREQVLQPKVVELGAAVRRATRLIERTFGEHIRIELDLADDVPTVEIDPTQLERTILNMALNARDAMPAGGLLRLSTGRTEVDPRMARARDITPGRHAVLRVADTGVGMDEETRQRVFEPFFTRDKEHGTGLGLAMAYGFVRQSGGLIEVESTLGRGTVFTLLFPAVDQEPDELPETRAAPTPGPGLTGTILVVEDDPRVRRTTVRLLERAGLSVEAFETAEEGLDALEGDDGGRFDLLLSDLGLPGISGRELAERVRELRPDLPVVIMSGYATGSPGSSRALPSDIPFIQKPFTPTHMLQVLRDILEDGSSPPSPESA